MIPVFTVLLVLTLSLLIVRFATVGLTMTGVSKDLAQFQALSAFTGSGFTTKESEEIVTHPVRRRIVMHLMLLGNGGIVLAISSVMLSFVHVASRGSEPSSQPLASAPLDSIGARLLVLIAGVLCLWIAANSPTLEQIMWRINTWALRRIGKIEIHDYTKLLRLAHNYVVWELRVQKESWLADRLLQQLQLNREGILVLGIERLNGKYLGAPRGTTRIQPDDCLILYGRQEDLADLEHRRADLEGNMHHVMAVTRQLDFTMNEEQKTRAEQLHSSKTS